MHKVLSFGSLNIDYTYRVPHFVGAGETLGAEEVQSFCGGKGLNQSIALARAGAAVYHAGSIGADGVFLLDALKEAGVNTEFVTICDDQKTGHAIIQNTADGENCILLFAGANKSITAPQTDAVLEHFESGDLLVLQNEISGIPYLIRKAREKGLTIAFTPAPMHEAVLSYPLNDVDYILLNETEAKALTKTQDGRISTEALAQKLSAQYPHVRFVLTLGSAGALYIHRTERLLQSAFPVKAVDTTAAGDTFAGYFLQSLAAGTPEQKALEIAAKAAALCVTKSGAAPSIPTLQEVLDF